MSSHDRTQRDDAMSRRRFWGDGSGARVEQLAVDASVRGPTSWSPPPEARRNVGAV